MIDGTLDTVTASMAKWWLTDQQWRQIDECLQLFGGYGYMLEYPVARAFLDARIQTHLRRLERDHEGDRRALARPRVACSTMSRTPRDDR